MARLERYILTDTNNQTRVVVVGPSIGYDGAEIAMQPNKRMGRSIVALPDRLDAPDLFDFRYFRTPGTAVSESGSQTPERVRSFTSPYFKGRRDG